MTKHADVLATSDTAMSARAGNHDASRSDTTRGVAGECVHALRWRQIASALGACGGEWEKTTEQKLRSSRLDDFLDSRERRCTNARIEVLDRPTSASAVLSWRDSTGGSYGHQIWQKGVARRSGICAISGSPICRGDAIYRPVVASTRPSNASAMILAAYIDGHPQAARRPYLEQL